MSAIQAVFFDFDGLLLDTETPWYKTYQEIFARHNVSLPLSIWSDCVGTYNRFDPHDYLQQQSGKSFDRVNLMAEARRVFTRIMKEAEPLPGARQMIQQVKKLGLHSAIVSSSDMDWIHEHGNRHGLLEGMEGIFCSNDVKQVKPAPDLYLLACRHFRLKGNQTLVFEDSLHGLDAAVAAGCYCVIVPNAVTNQLKFQNESARLDSLLDVDLKGLIAQFS